MAGSSNFMGLPAGFANDSPFPPLRSPVLQAQPLAAGPSRPRPSMQGSHMGAGYGYATPSRPSVHGVPIPVQQRPHPSPQFQRGDYGSYPPQPYAHPVLSDGPPLPLPRQQSLHRAHAQGPIQRPGTGAGAVNGGLHNHATMSAGPIRRAPSQQYPPASTARLQGPPSQQQRVSSAPTVSYSSTYPGSPVGPEAPNFNGFMPHQPIPRPRTSTHAPGGAPVGGLPAAMPMPAPYQPSMPSPGPRSSVTPSVNGYPAASGLAVAPADPQTQYRARRSDASLHLHSDIPSIGSGVEAMWPFTSDKSKDLANGANRHASSRSTPSQGRTSDVDRRSSSNTSSISSAPSKTDIVVFLPALADLGRIREEAWASRDEQKMLSWCRQVLHYVERKHESNKISEPILVGYIDQAMRTIKQLASAKSPLPEALYVRGDLLNSGAFPSYYRKDLKAAFNDFELSARNGYAPSWFRIGRDYELLNDLQHARDAYERGCSVQDVGSIYRMGMANLLGQLELEVDYDMAMPLLKEAADLSNLETPQPSYVYGMLLIGEFSHIKIPKHLLDPTPDPQRPETPATLEGEARRRMQRSAYLNFPPAQYRCGWHHEYALLECPFDPLRSVEYYSLASQGGEMEADLALSKWFLCGAEGCFDKNEHLAFTFAEKAAKKGLPSAEFAMGYYNEVGVGCQPNISAARDWYERAAAHDNTDAKERLSALKGSQANLLSRKQHEAHVDSQLQRKRTEAKMISDKRRQQQTSSANASSERLNVPSKPANGVPPSSIIANLDGQQPSAMPRQSAELRRTATMRMVEDLAYRSSKRTSVPTFETIPEQPHSQERPHSRSDHGRVDGLPLPAANNLPFLPTPRPPMHQPQPSQGSSVRTVTTPSRPSVSSANSKANPSTHTVTSSAHTVTSRDHQAAAAPSQASTQSSPKPPSSIVLNAYGETPGSGSGSSQSSSGGGSSVHTGSQGSKRVYETFSEMGFKSSKTSEDRDCVVC